SPACGCRWARSSRSAAPAWAWRPAPRGAREGRAAPGWRPRRGGSCGARCARRRASWGHLVGLAATVAERLGEHDREDQVGEVQIVAHEALLDGGEGGDVF